MENVSLPECYFGRDFILRSSFYLSSGDKGQHALCTLTIEEGLQ